MERVVTAGTWKSVQELTEICGMSHNTVRKIIDLMRKDKKLKDSVIVMHRCMRVVYDDFIIAWRMYSNK